MLLASFLAEEEGMLSAFFNLRNLILMLGVVVIVVLYLMHRRKQL